MASAVSQSSLRAVIGGETVRIGDAEQTITGIARKHDRIVNVPGAVAATAVTLWDSSVDPVTTFKACEIHADPDGLRATDQDINIRVTINGLTPTLIINKTTPLKLGRSAQTTGAITKVEALNIAGTTVLTDDVVVRMLALAA